MRNIAIWTFLCLSFLKLTGQERFKGIVTDTYVLEGAWVISKPGEMPLVANILIEDGLIRLIGSRIPYPANAEILQMDSMYVYAGFIAPLSQIGIPQGKKDEEPERVKDPGNPPNDRAGITPEISAFDFIDSNEKSIKDWRSAGFTTAHVVPRGNMLPGQSAIINLNGDTPDVMLIRKDVAMFSQLKGARRMYPATIIAVMAKWRDLYRKAEYAQIHEKVYAKSPVGIERPDYDRSIKAFYPVINKEQEVYISAQNTLDISRAISLQKELGFDMVLAEVKQAWPNTEALREGRYMVLLSLDIPDAPEEEKEKEEKQKEDEEVLALKARKLQAKHEYQSQAFHFEKEEIPFSFSYLDSKADKVLEQINTMIGKGLSEQKALEALTTTPASLLGIQDICGTVETGKIANLTILDKPLFDKDAQIKYVFVDGVPFEMKIRKKAKIKAGKIDVVSGNWHYTLNTPIGERKGRFSIILDNEEYTVFISSEDSPEDLAEVDELEIDGPDVRFKFTTDVNGMAVTFKVSFTVDGDSLEGSFGNDTFGEMPLNGYKLNKPK